MGRPLNAGLLTLPVVILLTALFVLGVALLLAAIAVYFSDIADIYQILLPALMFTAPIVYPRTVATPALSHLLRLNPITLYVEAFRAPLYASEAPSFASVAAMALVALATLLVGWIAFTRSTDDIPYHV